uniref:AlNc14C351G10911 protein n=1 Tax=Albugo laibachii Nc14 TaxID=890382 RepID=F0WXG1_9STRA|nr:AlNc14C351G10911 [Albugo laibachii Nc14]|eukprot:CCA26153.1 AlNc14C351G10911 [Albugo laibachii Nc14]
MQTQPSSRHILMGTRTLAGQNEGNDVYGSLMREDVDSQTTDNALKKRSDIRKRLIIKSETLVLEV